MKRLIKRKQIITEKIATNKLRNEKTDLQNCCTLYMQNKIDENKKQAEEWKKKVFLTFIFIFFFFVLIFQLLGKIWWLKD